MNVKRIALYLLFQAFLTGALFADDEVNISNADEIASNSDELGESKTEINESGAGSNAVSTGEVNINNTEEAGASKTGEVNLSVIEGVHVSNTGEMYESDYNAIDVNNAEKFYIGLAAGFTSNSLYTSGAGREHTEYQNGNGFEFALPFRYVIYPWLALQMEVQYIQKNYTWTRTGPYSDFANVNNNFFNVPLMVNFSLGIEKIKVFVNAGAYLGYWITSNVQGSMKEITADPFEPDKEYHSKYDETVDLDNSYYRFDAGLLASLGLQMLSDRLTFFIEGRYCYGLTDMQSKNDYGLIIPRINNTLDIRFGLFIPFDTIRNTFKREGK